MGAWFASLKVSEARAIKARSDGVAAAGLSLRLTDDL
jgi:hypothetical protein